MKKFSAARQDFCRAAGFLPEPPRFGRSVTDFPSFQLFPTFRPFGRRFSNVSAVRPPFLTFWPCERRFRRVLADLHRNLRDRGARVTFTRFGRFPRFGRSATVFTSSRPCNHRFPGVLADLHRYVRDRGARVTFPRFPPFWPFSTVSAVRPPFSNVSAVSATVFQRFGRATTASPRFGPANAVFAVSWPMCTVTYVTAVPGSRLAVSPRFGRLATVIPSFRPCEQRFPGVLAVFHRSCRDPGGRVTLIPCQPFRPFGHRFPSVSAVRPTFPLFRPVGHRFHIVSAVRTPFSPRFLL